MGDGAKKNKGGRPTKLNAEVQKTICDAIAAGVPIQVAAALAGVCNSQFYVWVKKHKGFADAIKIAAAKSETRLVGVIAKAAIANWTAAAWLLERHPKTRERWSRFQQPNSNGVQTNSTTSSTPTKDA